MSSATGHLQLDAKGSATNHLAAAAAAVQSVPVDSTLLAQQPAVASVPVGPPSQTTSSNWKFDFAFSETAPKVTAHAGAMCSHNLTFMEVRHSQYSQAVPDLPDQPSSAHLALHDRRPERPLLMIIRLPSQLSSC